jgi:hypothetical protein
MNDSQKPSRSDLLFSLLIFPGFMIVVCAIPLGLFSALFVHACGWDWYWAVGTGAAESIAAALAGGVLLGIGILLDKRCRSQRR